MKYHIIEAEFRGRFVFEGIQLGVYSGHRAAAREADTGYGKLGESYGKSMV